MKSFIVNLSLSIIFISCLPDGKIEHSNQKSIHFWHSFVASSIPAINEMIEKYELENPDIKIVAQYVPSGDPLIQKLITAIHSGTTPDIAWIHTDFLDKLVQADAIFKMDYFIHGNNGFSDEEYDDFFPQLLQNAKWGDALYAIPMEATTLALIYNKTMFKEAGIDPEKPPSNWNELKKYVDILTFDSNNDDKFDQYGFYIPVFPASGPLSIWMLLQWEPFLWQAGGNLINNEQTKVLFNEKPGVLALNLWKEIYDKMKFNSFSLSHDMAFISGTVAMIMDGPWNLPLYRKITDFEWGIAHLPKGPEKQATYLAGEYLTIFKNSKYADESWKFIKWFTQPEIQAIFSMKSGYLPVRKSTLDLQNYKEYLEKDKYLSSFVDQIKIAHSKSNIKSNKVEINILVSAAIEKTLVGNEDSQETLNEAASLAKVYLTDDTKEE